MFALPSLPNASSLRPRIFFSWKLSPISPQKRFGADNVFLRQQISGRSLCHFEVTCETQQDPRVASSASVTKKTRSRNTKHLRSENNTVLTYRLNKGKQNIPVTEWTPDKAKKHIVDLLRRKRAAEAQQFFESLPTLGVEHDLGLYSFIIRGCLDRCYDDIAAQLRSQMMAFAKPSVEFYNSVLTSYIRRREYGTAIEWWESCMLPAAAAGSIIPDLYSYSSIIKAFIRFGDLDRALQVRQQMRDAGFSDNVFTFTSFISAFARKGAFDEIEKLRREAEGGRVQLDAAYYNALIDAYCRGDMWKLSKALDIKHLMLKRGGACRPDVATYCSLMGSYLTRNDLDQVNALRREMQQNGIQETDATYNMRMKWLIGQKRYEDALAVKDEMMAAGVEPSVVTYSTVVKALGRVGRTDEFAAVQQQLVSRRVRLNHQFFNTMIDGYVRNKQLVMAAAVKDCMVSLGLRPDVITYTLLLEAYIANHMIDNALQVRDEMREARVYSNRYVEQSLGRLKKEVYGKYIEHNPFFGQHDPHEFLPF